MPSPLKSLTFIILLLGALLVPGQALGRPSAQLSLSRTLSASLQNAGGADGAEVRDLNTGRTLFAVSANAPRLPASVEKLYTTSTALLRFGATATLSTSILGAGRLDAGGTWHGTIVLRGDGDPTFGSAAYDRYAYGTGATLDRLVTNFKRQSGIRAIRGQIIGDESIFDSLRGTPATGYGASSYVEGQLSGLAYDRGFADEQNSSFQARPALFAAQRLTDALRSAGVRVAAGTRVGSGILPAGAHPLATVRSPRMATLLRLTNSPSDNFLAEMLLKGIGARFGAGGTTAAGAGVVRAQLARSFGIRARLVDGSGLSRQDHTSPHQVVRLLAALAGNRVFAGSLSVAGESGTTRYGLAGTPAQRRCQAKTGTLHDVANLAGYCTARDGHRLAFAFLMNNVDPTSGHDAEYAMAVALARYSG